jgi:hypothetical protein
VRVRPALQAPFSQPSDPPPSPQAARPPPACPRRPALSPSSLPLSPRASISRPPGPASLPQPAVSSRGGWPAAPVTYAATHPPAAVRQRLSGDGSGGDSGREAAEGREAGGGGGGGSGGRSAARPRLSARGADPAPAPPARRRSRRGRRRPQKPREKCALLIGCRLKSPADRAFQIRAGAARGERQAAGDRARVVGSDPERGCWGARRAPAPLASRSRSRCSSGARAAASSATTASHGAVTSRPPPNRRARPRSPAWARTRAHGLGQKKSAGGRGPAQRPGLELQRLAGAARGAPEPARLPAWTAGHGGLESSAGGARVTGSVRWALQVLRRPVGRAVNSPGESLVKDEPLGVLGRHREAESPEMR